MQKSIIVTGYWNVHGGSGDWEDTTNELNMLLSQGYHVVSATPMGAYGYGYAVDGNEGPLVTLSRNNGFASLVILRKTSRNNKQWLINPKPEAIASASGVMSTRSVWNCIVLYSEIKCFKNR